MPMAASKKKAVIEIKTSIWGLEAVEERISDWKIDQQKIKKFKVLAETKKNRKYRNKIRNLRNTVNGSEKHNLNLRKSVRKKP